MGRKESTHERKLGGNRGKEQERRRGRVRERERERVGEITRPFTKGERDHVSSTESVCKEEMARERAIVQERESACKKMSVRA